LYFERSAKILLGIVLSLGQHYLILHALEAIERNLISNEQDIVTFLNTIARVKGIGTLVYRHSISACREILLEYLFSRHSYKQA
jgi:hypothetical protein